MSQESIFRPILHSAEEKLSEVEEEWLEEALELIKQQRMALQMERIQLETRRQQLLNLNIDDIIAERERLANQERAEEPMPPTEPQKDDDSGTSSLSEMEIMSQGSTQNLNDLCNGEDIKPDTKDVLIPDLAEPIANITISGQDTSSKPVEGDNVPIGNNMSMDMNAEEKPKE